jgi:hypothetical protein
MTRLARVPRRPSGRGPVPTPVVKRLLKSAAIELPVALRELRNEMPGVRGELAASIVVERNDRCAVRTAEVREKPFDFDCATARQYQRSGCHYLDTKFPSRRQPGRDHLAIKHRRVRPSNDHAFSGGAQPASATTRG